MAKQMRRDDFDDGPAREGEARAGLVDLPPQADPEKLALAARVAELEALLALREARIVEETPGARADYWQVEVQYAPRHVVRAADAANAWEKYKVEMGVINSEHVPRAAPATREDYHAAQARRHGRKVDEYQLAD